MFNHVDMGVILEDIKAQTIDGSRVYVVEGNNYPSISTICSFRKRHSIAEWRKRVGEAEANKISTRAASAGTTLHSMVEDYLNNNQHDWRSHELGDWQYGFYIRTHNEQATIIAIQLYWKLNPGNYFDW